MAKPSAALALVAALTLLAGCSTSGNDVEVDGVAISSFAPVPAELKPKLEALVADWLQEFRPGSPPVLSIAWREEGYKNGIRPKRGGGFRAVAVATLEGGATTAVVVACGMGDVYCQIVQNSPERATTGASTQDPSAGAP